jgi:hypothetical protein
MDRMGTTIPTEGAGGGKAPDAAGGAAALEADRDLNQRTGLNMGKL